MPPPTTAYGEQPAVGGAGDQQQLDGATAEEVAALRATVQGLEARLVELTAAFQALTSTFDPTALTAELADVSNDTRQYYGRVDVDWAYVYATLPSIDSTGKTVTPSKRVAKIPRGRSIRMTYPQVTLQVPRGDGSIQEQLWRRVHVVDRRSGTVEVYWTPDVDPDTGAKVFAEFGDAPLAAVAE